MNQLPLPISPSDFNRLVVTPAMALLPAAMDSPKARIMLIAICLQESNLNHRWQVVNGGGKGPARGLAQFEQGTRASRGGVWGVYLHDASRYWLGKLCEARKCAFDPVAIYQAIESDDVLAVGVARLLLFTDPMKLPEPGDREGAWRLYAQRCWRPGKPHPEIWPKNHALACAEVLK